MDYRKVSIAHKYNIRLNNIPYANRAMLMEVKEVLKAGLIEATQVELYDRTTLQVSYEMLRSCNAIIRHNMVLAGYGVGKRNDKAKHAVVRINMRGHSVKDGHWLMMNPEKYIMRTRREELRAIYTKFQKTVLGV